MTREKRIEFKEKYNGPVYDIPHADVGRPCKSCSITLHWVKTEAGKWMPVEYDGIPHWGLCDEPERFKGKNGE